MILTRLTVTPAAYAVIVATHPASANLKQSDAPNGEFYVGSGRNMWTTRRTAETW